MRLSTIFLLFFVSIALEGQEFQREETDSISVSGAQLKQTLDLLKDLDTKGIDILNDSMIISEEFNRLLSDPAYYAEIYPEAYTWEQTIAFIESKELKKAFWYMINLYPQNDKNKEMVVRSVLAYEAAIKMDKVLVNTFYTYAFADPESSKIVNNMPEIIQPNVFESKLRTVKELIFYIKKYREQKAG